jgi:Universal stress protein family
MKILHPTDFSECAAKAEVMAVDLASKLDGEIVLLQVLVETPLYGEGLLNSPDGGTVRGDRQDRGGRACGPDRHGHTRPSRAQPPPAGQRRRAGGPSGHLPCADGPADEGW